MWMGTLIQSGQPKLHALMHTWENKHLFSCECTE